MQTEMLQRVQKRVLQKPDRSAQVREKNHRIQKRKFRLGQLQNADLELFEQP